MNSKKVVEELHNKYPGKKIFKNEEGNPTEILCEVEPSTDHLEYSLAVAVIDKSFPHNHKKSKETYKVTKGKLSLFVDGKKHELNEGEELVIEPGQTHWAEGDETWIECYSEPGWTFEDHILVDQSRFAVSTYDKMADKYTQMYFNDLTDIPYIDKFIKLLPDRARVLDIGCGPGTFTKYLHQKGFEVEGIDLSKEMIKIAQQKVPEITFKLMDMRELKYPKNTFDGILAGYSVIHIPSEEMVDTLKGFGEALKDNGFLMIIAQGGEPDKIVDEPLIKGEKVFINFFTKKRLTKFLVDAGFEVEYQEETDMKDPDSLSDRVIYTIARKK